MRNCVLTLIVFLVPILSQAQLHEYGEEPITVLVMKDGKTAVTASKKGFYLKFWDIESGDLLHEMKFDYISELKLSADGSKVIFNNTGYRIDELVIVNPETKKIEYKKKTRGFFSQLQFDYQATRLFKREYEEYSNGKSDPRTEYTLNPLYGDAELLGSTVRYDKKVESVSYPLLCPKNNSVLYITHNLKKKSLTLWQRTIGSDSSRAIATEPLGGIVSPDVYLTRSSDDGRYLIVKGWGVKDYVWIDTREGTVQPFNPSDVFSGSVETIQQITESGIVLQAYNGKVKLYDFPKQEMVSEYKVSDAADHLYRCVGYNFHSNRLSYPLEGKKARILDLMTGEKITDLEGTPISAEEVAASEKAVADLIADAYAQAEREGIKSSDDETDYRPDPANHKLALEQNGVKVYYRSLAYSPRSGVQRAKINVVILNDSGEAKNGTFKLVYSDGTKAAYNPISYCISSGKGNETQIMSEDVAPTDNIKIEDLVIKSGCDGNMN